MNSSAPIPSKWQICIFPHVPVPDSPSNRHSVVPAEVRLAGLTGRPQHLPDLQAQRLLTIEGTSTESAFFGRVNHRLTSFFSFLPSLLVGFVSQLNKQLSPTSLQFASG